MKVNIFGLGYVGSVMAGCLAKAGHDVLGVDVQAERVEQVKRGESPVAEPGLAEHFAQAHEAGTLDATKDVSQAMAHGNISFLCVGTPSKTDGSLDTSAVENVCEEIGLALAGSPASEPHTVVIRSTVMPGTLKRCEDIMRQTTNTEPGPSFRLLINPEFLREGSAVADFHKPPFTLLGCDDPAWASPLKRLYDFLDAPVLVYPVGVAEIHKVICNAWHATKVSFANEVGRLCKGLEVDSQQVMELFVQDEKLNLSAYYLRPGFAYGGSCLPKDVKALGFLSRKLNMELPVMENLTRSNRRHIKLACDRIEASTARRVAFLGISFKPGTDDLRGSPLLDLVEFCLGKGMEVSIHDPGVQAEKLVGANLKQATQRLGHLADYLVNDITQLTNQADLFVLGHTNPDFADFCKTLPKDKRVLDLVGMLTQEPIQAAYESLCG